MYFVFELYYCRTKHTLDLLAFEKPLVRNLTNAAESVNTFGAGLCYWLILYSILVLIAL